VNYVRFQRTLHIENMSIGKTVKLLRIAIGIKQRSLAKRMGVTPNYLSLVEGEKREPSLIFLKLLSRKLNVPIGFLFLEDIEGSRKIGQREKELYQKIKDLLFEVQRIKFSNRKSKGLHKTRNHV